MPYKDVHERLTERRDKALNRMMIQRYSVRPNDSRPTSYPREPWLERHFLSFLKRALGKLLVRLGQKEETELVK